MSDTVATPGGGIGPELVAIHRDMLRFAELQLRDHDTAEDVVQDAIAAAMTHAADFSGRSSLKTWIFAILKNKITDVLRTQHRTVSLSSFADEDDDREALDVLFNEAGAWRPECRPTAWKNPEQALTDEQFWQVFEACLNHLPPNLARVFMMREHLEFDTEEICSRLEISTGNLHVILHRARMRLRKCLDNNWFH